MVTLSKYGAKYNRNILFLEGLSTDTKPTDEFDGLSIQNGSEYTEVDTGKKFLFDYDNATWYEVQTGGGGGGGGGTSNYNDLSNRPSVNNTVLTGNKTSAQLGLASSEQGGKADSAIQGVKLNGGSVITPDANNIVDISVPITAIQKNGTGITPVSGAVNITVPTQASDINAATATQGSKADTAIQGIKVNSSTVNPDVNKVVNITVPTTAADVSALPNTTKYAAALSLTINSSTFVMTGQLKDQNGDNLGTAQTIDLPLESVVVGGSYNSQTKKVVLTLQNGNTIEFSVADLVSGLQTELSASNKLNPAYIDYDSTHRAVSDTEKSTWNGKQSALTTEQLAAVNSGITSADVAQITTNENNISSLTAGKNLIGNDTKLYPVNLEVGDNFTISTSNNTNFLSATNLLFFDENRNFINYYGLEGRTYRAMTLPASLAGTKYVAINKQQSVPIQLEYGSTKTSYEPLILNHDEVVDTVGNAIVDKYGNRHNSIQNCIDFEAGKEIDITSYAASVVYKNTDGIYTTGSNERLTVMNFYVPSGTTIKTICGTDYVATIAELNAAGTVYVDVPTVGWNRNKSYTTTKDSTIIIVAKRADDGQISNENFDGHFTVQIDTEFKSPNYFKSEMLNTIATIRSKIVNPCLVIPMFTDAHYMHNGVKVDNITDCINNIAYLSKKIKCDFVCNLGDNTNGALEATKTLEYDNYILNKVLEINAPYYQCIGNHDDNRYYDSGSETLTLNQIYSVYLSNSDNVYNSATMNGTNYYKDFGNLKIRCIWLNANDNGDYGYSNDTVTWFTTIALDTPDNYSIIVFTHIDPISSHNYNNLEITNGSAISTAIANYESATKHVIALFSGHNHVDGAWTTPYLSITTNCQKFETENGDPSLWPSGATKPTRTIGTASEDCWDVIVVNPTLQKVSMVRFGAGTDREYTYGS